MNLHQPVSPNSRPAARGSTLEVASAIITISRLSQLTGASVRALRHYEAEGLLHPIRTPSRERLYPPAQSRLAQEIVLLRSLDFSIEDIRRLTDRDRPRTERAGRLMHALERLLADLENKVGIARNVLERLEGGEETVRPGGREAALIPTVSDSALGRSPNTIRFDCT